MNNDLKQVAEKEAEEESNRYNDRYKQPVYDSVIKGFDLCLNILAGSEGDVNKVIDEILDCKGLNDKNEETGYFNFGAARDILQQHTASAVAKALGSKWLKIEDATPEEKKPYWIYGEILTVFDGWQTSISNEPAYFKNGDWYNEKEWQLISKITHYMPYELPQPPIK